MSVAGGPLRDVRRVSTSLGAHSCQSRSGPASGPHCVSHDGRIRRRLRPGRGGGPFEIDATKYAPEVVVSMLQNPHDIEVIVEHAGRCVTIPRRGRVRLTRDPSVPDDPSRRLTHLDDPRTAPRRLRRPHLTPAQARRGDDTGVLAMTVKTIVGLHAREPLVRSPSRLDEPPTVRYTGRGRWPDGRNRQQARCAELEYQNAADGQLFQPQILDRDLPLPTDLPHRRARVRTQPFYHYCVGR